FPMTLHICGSCQWLFTSWRKAVPRRLPPALPWRPSRYAGGPFRRPTGNPSQERRRKAPCAANARSRRRTLTDERTLRACKVGRQSPNSPRLGEPHGAGCVQFWTMANNSEDVQRSSLPIPNPDYTGTVVYDATSPDNHYPPIEKLVPPEGAPNVLVVLIDDTGFGASSSFGGPIATPNFERVA